MRVVIGLGANLGDRLVTLREAALRIARAGSVLARSHVWETAPVGGPAQPDFLNAALVVEWSRRPIDLLDTLMTIEAELGRVRDVPNGPRTIDLDILWIDGSSIDEPRLVVPHPRLHQRAFALAPMLEVVPDAVDPRTGERYVVPKDDGVRPTGIGL
ncbi:MAG TPA: 2-amino-4-hydroxy-6-hydroxymethyldihydropteridine diphosphokinase [Labilithrix sp.]|nr:2-amino-4-hydroxy-6-hydroxymethyldihydropteridine diphosphokinase [Labilithrix sp.]